MPPGNSATDESGSRRTAAHAPRIDVSQLTRTAPPHLASAGQNSLTPNTRTQGKQRRRGSLRRKRAWGGTEPWADGSMGRTGVWGGREYGAEGSMGRKGVWGGREYGAEGSMGRKAHPDTPASTLTLKLRHFSARREASTLFRRGGEFGKMFRSLKLKMAETESFNQRNAPRLTGGTPATRPRMTAICRPAEVPPLRATHRIPLIARRPLFRGRLAGPKHALLRQVVPDSTWMAI